MRSTNTHIRVHLLAPSVFGITDTISAAHDLLRSLGKESIPISFHLVEYPEVDFIDDLEYDKDWDGKKWIVPNRVYESAAFHREYVAESVQYIPTETRRYLSEPEDMIKRMESAFIWMRKECRNMASTRDFLILMDPYGNKDNYFSAKSPHRKNVAFIQTSHKIIDDMVAPHIPVAYEILALTLRFLGFNTANFQRNFAHEESRGCVNDAFGRVYDIRHRMLTADICEDCLKHLKSQGNVNEYMLEFFINAFEQIREKQHVLKRYRNDTQIKLKVDLTHSRLVFPEIGVSVRFSPKEMTIYRFFMDKGERGVSYKEMIEFKDELIEGYLKQYKGSCDNPRATAETIVARWTNPYENDDLRQTISKINSKIKKQLGPNLSMHFMLIKNETGRIQLTHFGFIYCQ